MDSVKLASSLVLIFGIASCRTPAPKTNAPDTSQTSSAAAITLSYAGAQSIGLNEEFVPANESAAFDGFAVDFAAIHAQQQQQNGGTTHLRGMHAKGHGCLNGTLKVTTTNPALKHGLFAENRTFDVTARFSNGSGLVESDSSRDLRGMAIRVATGGLPQLAAATTPHVQDLLMTNAPVHHASDIVELMGFIKANAAGSFARASFFLTHPYLASTLISQTSRTVESLVSESYWSRAAYRLGGNQAMKYAVVPCEPVTMAAGIVASAPDRLTKELDWQLTHRESTCFKLNVQVQQDPIKDPIENHAVAWQAPQSEVGIITFLKQTPTRDAICENLVFNPWNGLVDHQPLGNFNRARKHIYAAAAAFRHESPQQ